MYYPGSYRVTVSGESKYWATFEFAMFDALARGFSDENGWEIVKLPMETPDE